MGSGVDKSALRLSTYDVLMGQATLEEAVLFVEGANYALLPSNTDLIGAEAGLLDELGRELRLRHALQAVRDEYDYVLIDCPPALNMLTVNALVAADAVNSAREFMAARQLVGKAGDPGPLADTGVDLRAVLQAAT